MLARAIFLRAGVSQRVESTLQTVRQRPFFLARLRERRGAKRPPLPDRYGKERHSDRLGRKTAAAHDAATMVSWRQPRCLSSHVCIRNKEGARKGPYWGNTIAIGTGRGDTAECTTLVANALMKNMPVKILRNPDAVRIS